MLSYDLGFMPRRLPARRGFRSGDARDVPLREGVPPWCSPKAYPGPAFYFRFRSAVGGVEPEPLLRITNFIYKDNTRGVQSKLSYYLLPSCPLFFSAGLKKGDTLFQPLDIIHDAVAGITRTAHPSAKRSSLVAVIQRKDEGRLSATFTKTILRPGRAVFFARRGQVAAFKRAPPAPNIPTFVFVKLVIRNVRSQYEHPRPHVSDRRELHQFLLVAASLQFVEERGELLVIELYPC